MSAFRFRAVALLMLVLHLGACTTWTTYAVSPREVIVTQRPNRVRVTTLEGVRRELEAPTIEGDSVAYYFRTHDLSTGERVRLRGEPLSVDDIVDLEVPSFDGSGTATIVGAVVIAVGSIFAYALSMYSSGGR